MEASNNPSNDSGYSGSKRRRITSDGKENALADRISGLPNPLILHILSFLTTKLAARTSLLSKKWKYLWISVPVIDFHGPIDSRCYRVSKKNLKKNLNNFVSFVNRRLILNESLKIEKFRLHFNYDKAYASVVDVWLRFATRKNVKELNLDFSHKVHSSYYSSITDEDNIFVYDVGTAGPYVLPMAMFSKNPSLVTLKLKNIEMDRGSLINLKSLKFLSLSKMSTNNDFITKMLSGSPSLELLELIGCCNYTFLDIKSERLRKLVIHQRNLGGPGEPLKITAPYLQSLDISGVLYDFSIFKLSSLVDAKLNFEMPSGGCSDLNGNRNKYTKILVKLLGSLWHVKDLTVESWCLQVLSMLGDKALPSGLSSGELPGIARLLTYTPMLETLVINMTSDDLDLVHSEIEFIKSYDLGVENWLSQKSSVLPLLYLKTVRTVNFQATKSEVELLLFLLKNACKLEKMIIHAQDTTDVNLKISLKAAQMLSTFPRCSRDAVVFFT